MRRAVLQKVLTWAAAVLYMLAGTSHFLNPAAYVKIMPPHPLTMIYISGLAEIVGGIGLLISPLRKVAVFELIALLVAIFPANIYMAMNNIQVTSAAIPNWLLWARLPVQIVLAWWLWAIR